MERIKGRMVKIPTTGRIKIRGDMYGPLNTPHFETLDDIKLMLTYGVEVTGFKAVGGAEEKLTLENYANENIITLGNECIHDATTEKPKTEEDEEEEEDEDLGPHIALFSNEVVEEEEVVKEDIVKEEAVNEQPKVQQEQQPKVAQAPVQKNKNKK